MSHRSGALPAALRSAIAQARHKRSLSQAELGKLVGLPQAHISGIESGRVVPRYDTLLDHIRVLGHDLVLVPRELVSVVEALVRDRNRQAHAAEGEEGPLYEPDGDDDEDWDGRRS